MDTEENVEVFVVKTTEPTVKSTVPVQCEWCHVTFYTSEENYSFVLGKKMKISCLPCTTVKVIEQEDEVTIAGWLVGGKVIPR